MTPSSMPKGWAVAQIIIRRDRGWAYGGTRTYDALLEGVGDCEARGSDPDPISAVLNALAEIVNAPTDPTPLADALRRILESAVRIPSKPEESVVGSVVIEDAERTLRAWDHLNN